MDKKFEIGDRVRSKFYGVVGTIMEIDTDGYILKPDTDDDMWIADTDVEPYDPKTAFLSDLAAVLRKHNAEIIGGGFDGYGDYLQVRLGNESPFDVGEDNQYDGVVLTADNIMDYEKE
jgi:hypothetical protein